MGKIEFVATIICLITYLMVVADMFRKKISRGFCGLVFFPLTYYHSIRYYSGNKKIVATLLWSSTIIAISINLYFVNEAKEALKVFNQNVDAQLNISCKTQNDNTFVNSTRKYLDICSPSKMDQSSYKDVGDMVSGYQTMFIEPMLPIYKNTMHLDGDKAVIIGILSSFDVFACFEISNTGIITNSWSTDRIKPCDVRVVRQRDWEKAHPRMSHEEWMRKTEALKAAADVHQRSLEAHTQPESGMGESNASKIGTTPLTAGRPTETNAPALSNHGQVFTTVREIFDHYEAQGFLVIGRFEHAHWPVTVVYEKEAANEISFILKNGGPQSYPGNDGYRLKVVALEDSSGGESVFVFRSKERQFTNQGDSKANTGVETNDRRNN